VCVCIVGVCMYCGCVYVLWVCVCVVGVWWVCVSMSGCVCVFIVGVCMYGFCNVWVCVCVGFVMCGVLTIVWLFGNMCTCIYWVFVLFRLGLFILICY